MKKLQKVLPVIFVMILGIVTMLSLSACNRNSKADDMIAELQTTIDRNKADLDKKIADLTVKHDTQFEELKKVVFNDEQLLSDLKNLYNGKIFELENADAANKKAIADLKAEYDAKLNELQNGSDSGNNSGNDNGADNAEAIANLKAEYDAKIIALEKADNDNKKAIEDLTAKYNAKVEEIEDEIAEANAAIAANKTALETSIANLKTAYQTKVAELESLLETVQNTQTTQDEKIAELERKVAELIARLEPTVCTATFDSNGGTPVASQTVNKGEKLTRPADPTKLGDLFDGWYIEDEQWSFYGHIVTEDMTLKANWISSNLVYTLSDDKTCYSVTAYYGNAADVTIQSRYNGLPVTSIGSSVFKDCTSLTRVTIPNSVTHIGNAAFQNCSGLVSVTLTNSVKYIGNYAFQNCNELTSIALPDSVTEIGNGAFTGCIGLTSITIPDSVTHIGGDAFNGCIGFTSITIPNSVKYIGAGAFGGCSNLAEITIPFVGESKSTTSASSSTLFGHIFGRYSYEGGTATLQIFGDGTYDSQTYFIPTSLKKITVIGGNILRGAFQNCSSLTSVTLPDSVTSIGANAFAGCSGLEDLTAPNVTSVGTSAINNCNKIKNLTASTTVLSELPSKSYIETLVITSGDSIGDNMLSGETLTSVVLGDSITSIGSYSFYACSNLTYVRLSSNLTKVGEYSFSGNRQSVRSLTIPASLTEIGVGAFTGFAKESITVEKGNSKYHSAGNCLIETESKTLIAGCSTSVIPADGSVTSLSVFAFCLCDFTDISIPDRVTEIGAGAFFTCTRLTNVTIPDSVTTIEEMAFSDCTALESIHIGKGVTNIGNEAFTLHYESGPRSLISITVSSENEKYHSTGNCLIDAESKTLLLGCDTSVIPSDGSVSSISDYAFEGCSKMTSIIIPDSVLSIGYCTFFECDGLTSVYYKGIAENWNNISIGSSNTSLTTATRYYYSEEEPPLNGDSTAYDDNYWHFDDNGAVIVWIKENA